MGHEASDRRGIVPETAPDPESDGAGERRRALRVRVSAFLTFEHRVLLVGQRRETVPAGPPHWLLPGGGVRFGESLAEALVREVREELDVVVQPQRPIALAESVSPCSNYPKHVIHVIYAADLCQDVASRATPPAPRDPAVLAAQFFTAGELAALALHPPVADVLARFLERLPQHMEYLGRLW